MNNIVGNRELSNENKSWHYYAKFANRFFLIEEIWYNYCSLKFNVILVMLSNVNGNGYNSGY